MDTTQNFGLKKPGANDFVDIDVLNENMDIIDEKCARESWYGTCSTSYSTSTKVVTTTSGDFTLKAGHRVKVKFTYYNTTSSPYLNVDGTGAKYIKQYGTTAPLAYTWYSGEVVEFVFDGTYFIIADGGVANTTYYGVTKLSSSISSTAQNIAATPYAVKQAYDNADDAYDRADTAYALAEDAVPKTRKINGKPLDADIILDGIALKNIGGDGCIIGNTNPKSIYSAFYTNEKFFITTGATTFYTSIDGINWSTCNAPNGMRVAGGVYGNGLWILTGYDSNLAAYSADGVSWTQTTMPSSGRWAQVVFGCGIFVAVNSLNPKKIAYSADGISWTEGPVSLTCVAFGDGKFVGLSDNTYKPFYYSADGINWEQSSSTSMGNLRLCSIAYGAGKFIAVGSLDNDYTGANHIYYSNNGTSWSRVALSKDLGCKSLCAIAYGAGKFVATGARNSEYSIFSTDGIQWDKSYLPINLLYRKPTGWAHIAFGSGRFIAAPDYGYNIPYTEDGINWMHNGVNIIDSSNKGVLNDIRSALNIEPIKIHSGTYTGTGTYGTWDNKNSLAFDFVPKFLMIKPKSTTAFPTLVIVNIGNSGWHSMYYNATYNTQKTMQVCWSYNEFLWYSADSAQYQLNTSGAEYEYCAIG